MMSKVNNIAHRLVPLCLLLVALAGCRKEDTPAPDTPSGTPIAFTPETATKAAVSGEEDIQNDPNGFRVWGWFQGTTPGHMFGADGTPVKYEYDTTLETYVWTYEPTRYWMNGIYNFAAVYPASVSATYAATDGALALTVADFDVTDQHDLLVAFNNGTDGTGINGLTHPDYVTLDFKHVLSRVKIRLKLNEDDFFVTTEEEDEEGNKVNVTRPIGYGYAVAAGFKNISNVGTLSGTNATNWGWSRSETSDGQLNLSDMVVEYDSSSENNESISLGVEYVDILGSDGLFVIPQSFTDNNDANIYFNVGLIFPNISNRLITQEIEVPLNTLTTDSWEPNKVYTYLGTITQEFKIEFSIVSITDWGDDTLGGFIVN